MTARPLDADIDDFLDHCRVSRSHSPHTVLAYRQDLNEFARFLARRGDVPTSAALVLDYVAYLRDERGLRPATIRRRIACLRGLFKWLEKRRQGPTSPFRDLDLTLARPARLPRALTRQQLAAVTRAAEGGAPRPANARPIADPGRGVDDIARTTQLAIRLMAATGVRVGELTSVSLADVAGDGSAIRVSGKGNRERTVFVGNSRLRGLLAAYLADRRRRAPADARLFLNARGNALTPQCLRLRLKKLSQAVSLTPHLTPHRLRHTAATLLLEEGVDIRFVQRLLGHSSIATTEIYTHVTDASLKAAVERADPIGKWGI